LHPSALAKRVLFWLFLSIVAFYIYGLGKMPLLGPDEPRYAQVAREMLLSRDLITPTLGGHTWFEKPPLLYWMMVAAFRTFGVSEWSARLGPALCGLLTIAAVWSVGRQIERTTSSAAKSGLGFYSALMSASFLGMIVFSRAASFDMVITMTVTWALSFFLLEEMAQTHRYKTLLLIGFYVFVGLSLLAKGLVGIVIPFGVVGLYYLLKRAWPQRNATLSLLWGIPLILLVSGIWYGPVIWRHGWTFIDAFFVQHHFARYVSNKYHHPQPLYFYPAIILMLTLPWTGFFVDGVARLRSWTWRDADSLSLMKVLSFAWLLMPTLFFSFSASKLPGYILPVLPAAAFLTADRLTHFTADRDYSKWPIITTSIICLALALGGLSYASRSREISLTCAMLAGLPMLIAAACASGLFARKQDVLTVIACSTFVLVLIVLNCAASPIAYRESTRDLLKLADARGYSNVPVLAQRGDDRSAEFYASGRVVYRADGEPQTFDEVSLVEARKLGGKMLALIPVEHVENFRGSPGIEIIGDNGKVAILGWNVQ
jgi:4-amino-4-deoxy-L-arabinose transferase-like glycosyltransferase